MEFDRNKHKAPNLWRTNSLQWCRLGTACSGNRSAGKLRDVVIPLSWGLLDHMDSTASILGCPVEGRHHLTEGGQGRAKMVRAGALVLWAEAVRAGFVQPREGMACGNLKVPPSAYEGVACGHIKAVPMIAAGWTQAHCRVKGGREKVTDLGWNEWHSEWLQGDNFSPWGQWSSGTGC